MKNYNKLTSLRLLQTNKASASGLDPEAVHSLTRGILRLSCGRMSIAPELS